MHSYLGVCWLPALLWGSKGYIKCEYYESSLRVSPPSLDKGRQPVLHLCFVVWMKAANKVFCWHLENCPKKETGRTGDKKYFLKNLFVENNFEKHKCLPLFNLMFIISMCDNIKHLSVGFSVFLNRDSAIMSQQRLFYSRQNSIFVTVVIIHVHLDQAHNAVISSQQHSTAITVIYHRCYMVVWFVLCLEGKELCFI